uniref:Uncharacterized protein n=1 Tax=Trichogramma kaykai TaxID=54128 RepID=A0ABD2WBZ1_9HYME
MDAAVVVFRVKSRAVTAAARRMCTYIVIIQYAVYRYVARERERRRDECWCSRERKIDSWHSVGFVLSLARDALLYNPRILRVSREHEREELLSFLDSSVYSPNPYCISTSVTTAAAATTTTTTTTTTMQPALNRLSAQAFIYTSAIKLAFYYNCHAETCIYARVMSRMWHA